MTVSILFRRAGREVSAPTPALVDRGRRLVQLVVGHRAVDDVEDQISLERLFERGREAFDKLMRKSAMI
jgi:hypothetical protein